MEEEYTTIRVRKKDVERLAQYGKFGENYAEALTSALNKLENKP